MRPIGGEVNTWDKKKKVNRLSIPVVAPSYSNIQICQKVIGDQQFSFWKAALWKQTQNQKGFDIIQYLALP